MLESKKFAFALAQAAGIVYVVCAALVAVAPSVAWKMAGWISHMTNLEVLGRGLTFGGFLLGLVQVVIYAYVSGWLFSALYNHSLKK